MVGRKVRTAERTRSKAVRAGDQNRILLAVEHLTLPRRSGGYTLEEVSFSVGSGEIVGIYGLLGAGRTELFECLIGSILKPADRSRLRGSQWRINPLRSGSKWD